MNIIIFISWSFSEIANCQPTVHFKVTTKVQCLFLLTHLFCKVNIYISKVLSLILCLISNLSLLYWSCPVLILSAFTKVYIPSYSWLAVLIDFVHLYWSWVNNNEIPELYFASKYRNKTTSTVNERVLGCGFWVSRMSMMHRLRKILKGHK